MKMEMQVLGAKAFKGEVEGTFYDSTKLQVLMQHNESDDKAGFDCVDIAYGKSDNFRSLNLKALTFPLKCELDLNVTTKGFECVGFRPLPKA